MARIEVEKVSHAYRHREVLTDVSFLLEEGGVVALLGPNGSGKTTLIKLLLGLMPPGSGTIRLNDRPLGNIPRRELARQVAYVPQVHKEAFAYRVIDVVLMGRMPYSSLFRRYSASDRNIVCESLDKIGIAHLAERPYTEISGGERQMTLIARALAQGARIFIMDEPTNGLDYGNQVRLLERLKTMSENGCTLIFSTHHPDHAMAVADRIIMLNRGMIVRDGPTKQVITGESLREIYGIDLHLLTTQEGMSVCMPAMPMRLGE